MFINEIHLRFFFRGAAHVGIIKALREAGIPVDMVGGVSIGAFMGALWCQESDITTMTQKAREWSYVSYSFLIIINFKILLFLFILNYIFLFMFGT